MTTAAGRVEIPYPHRRAGHCGSGAFRDLLEFHDLSWTDAPLSEGMAFGAGAGLGFAYVELRDVDPPLYLVGRTAGLERDCCAHLGIALDLRRTDAPDEGWRWLRDELDAGVGRNHGAVDDQVIVPRILPVAGSWIEVGDISPTRLIDLLLLF